MNNVAETCGRYCSGCGLCETVCPVGAISMEVRDGNIRPAVSGKCISCGKCRMYCPNLSNEKFTYKEFADFAYGHSLNEKHRMEAASGGITSELLSYLVKEKYVDYIVTADEYHNDEKGSFCIADCEYDIFSKMGSNYCPINVGKALTEIKGKDGTCAIVCLPCLARGIRKLCLEDEILNRKIKYIITLLCNHVPSYNATEYLKKRYKTEEPNLIKYRGNGWFGFLRFFKVLGGRYSEYFSAGFSEYFSTGFSEYFWQNACVLCEDHFGKYSDIAMGDADFVKYRSQEENTGETICFINNLEMREILKDMQSKKIISLSQDASEDELSRIYGPLCTKRADSRNLEQDYIKIIRMEKKARCLSQLKGILITATKRVKNIGKQA